MRRTLSGIALVSAILLITGFVSGGFRNETQDFLKLPYAQQVGSIEARAQKSPEEALAFLSHVYESSAPGSEGHSFGHAIGNALYRKHGVAGIRLCTDGFAYGCQHGVTETAFADAGPTVLADLVRECETIFGSKEIIRQGACIHGIGHGLLIQSGSLADALAICNSLEEQHRRECSNGTLMENMVSFVARPAFENNPWIFCEGVPDAFFSECAAYIPAAVLQKDAAGNFAFGNHASAARVYDVCAAGKTESSRIDCIEGFGVLLAEKIPQRLDSIAADCGATEFVSNTAMCMMAAAHTLAESDARRAHEFCAMMPEASRTACKQEIHSEYE